MLVAALLAVLGFAVVVQTRQTQEDGLQSLRQSDLVRIFDNLQQQSARLDEEAQRLEAEQQELRTGTDRTAAAEAAARRRLEVLGILAGTLPATGPGIRLRIDDPDNRVTAAMLIDTVQELRDAGAEAIQVGGVRVVASTSFVDGPDGVIGGRRGPPAAVRVRRDRRLRHDDVGARHPGRRARDAAQRRRGGRGRARRTR